IFPRGAGEGLSYGSEGGPTMHFHFENMPQYLGQVQRYNAEQMGNVLAWTGLPQLLLITLVTMMMKRFDARYIGFLGISIFAIS
ncbi:hypothetical protein ACC736_38600, partial [Rhizobium ruizarguesonis]